MESHMHIQPTRRGVFGVWVSVEALLVPITSACGPQLAGNCWNRKRRLGYAGHAWLDLVIFGLCLHPCWCLAGCSPCSLHFQRFQLWCGLPQRDVQRLLPNYSPSTKWPKRGAVRMACAPTPAQPSMTYHTMLVGSCNHQFTWLGHMYWE